jgi:hypothetical protein
MKKIIYFIIIYLYGLDEYITKIWMILMSVTLFIAILLSKALDNILNLI